MHLHASAKLAAEAGCTEQEVVQFQAKLKKAHSAFSGCETPPSHASAPQSKVGLSSPPVVSDASSDATPSNNGRDNDCFSFSTHGSSGGVHGDKYEVHVSSTSAMVIGI